MSEAYEPTPRPEAPTPPAASPAASAQPAPPASHTGPNGLAATLAVALAAGLGGSYVFSRVIPPRPEAAAAREPTPAAETPSRAAETSRSLDALKTEVARLRKRLDDLPTPEPPPELAALQVRVADLSTAADKLKGVPRSLSRLNDRVIDLADSVRGVRDDVSALQSSASRASRYTVMTSEPGASPTTSARPRAAEARPRGEMAPSPKPEGSQSVEKALAHAEELFHQGKYSEAREAFSRLELDQPDDARVWYYGALSTGFATNHWTDDAARLADKGVACEKAGTPPAPEIDRAFEGLTTATGKDWLDYYRREAKDK
jgi:hypothetical protein